jgi:hypothetical protein
LREAGAGRARIALAHDQPDPGEIFARYRMLKLILMVVDLGTGTAELNLERLTELLSDDLPPIVFSDDPMTKMHNSLLMVLFRFEHILTLYEAEELGRWHISIRGS